MTYEDSQDATDNLLSVKSALLLQVLLQVTGSG